MRFPFTFNFQHSAASVLALGMGLFLGVGEPAALAAPGRPNRGPSRPMKPASESIKRQAPPKITPRVLEQINPGNARILIMLGRQRAYLMHQDGEIAIDTPVSTGKSAGMTPVGSYKVQQKDADHRSNLYGNFVDAQGRVVRAGVSVRIDSAPSGTRFLGAPMQYFLRVDGPVGMHVGYLPGYPASHGCIRMPEEIAPMFYHRVKLGTPVEIVN